MEPTIIMSKEFLEAVNSEIAKTKEVIINYQPDENCFELDDYCNYLRELQKLLDLTITE